jgi:hypothetical protein
LINLRVGYDGGLVKASRSMRPARVVWVEDAHDDGTVAGIEFLAHVTNFAGAA